jgi:hypothetical protein
LYLITGTEQQFGWTQPVQWYGQDAPRIQYVGAAAEHLKIQRMDKAA